MLRSLMLLPLLLLLGCGEDSSGDPSLVSFAPGLGVDLTAMERKDSGLYIQDLQPGTGETASVGRQVTVHYTGWLPNGTQFDTSRTRTPFTFTLGSGVVIEGWDEGLVGMKVDGIRKLVIPSHMAYGEQGRGAIPPNSVLVFDVELISIP